MVNSAYTINLDVLSDEDSWLICSLVASVDKDDEQLGKLGRGLANKCKGLPLAAKILGSVMGGQRSGINNIGECKLGELKNLVHLKGSLEIKGLENVTDVQEAENAQLKKKIHLRELRLWFGGEAENRREENDELVLNALEPHPELESLWIYGYGGTGYPNWVMSLTILKKLQLKHWDKLEQLPPLGKLCFLESLTISYQKRVKKVGVEFLGIESNRKKDEEKGSTSSLNLIP
nr:putative disease resistance protein [Quercus suber]